MKKFLTTTILLAMFTTSITLMAQTHQDDYLGLPGDNLNLYAVMKLFQESETLESFERNLNDENTRINNLDLNGDNLIDYIRVTDYVDRDVHNIVLQVAINNRENQDVAVFTVQRFQNGQVQIQLIGDEALYGRNYIIEPIYNEQYANQTPNPGYTGYPDGNVAVVRTNYYEVAAWPLIRFIFMPNYVVWHSDWHWGYYPPYWHSWQPCYWHYYSGYHYNWYNDYYGHYHRCDYARYDHWNDFYYSSRRSHSPYVSHRIETGHYRGTYSHPDQWKAGEELYARTNHDQGNRREDRYSENRVTRRSDNKASMNRQMTGTSFSTSRRSNTNESRSYNKPSSAINSGSERRSANTFSERSATNPVMAHNYSSDRRSTATSGMRSASPTGSVYNSGSSRKSAVDGSARPANQYATAYNSSPERRSSTASYNRPVANSKPAQSASNSRSMNKPAAKTESFSSRRSSGTTHSVKTSKSSDNKKSAETTRSSHRR